MRKFLRISTIFITLILFSCNDNSDEVVTTCKTNNPLQDIAWLKEIKTNFEIQVLVHKVKIVQYTYKNNTVFLIDRCVNCPDTQTVVYSCTKEVICTFGGISGENTCPNFENEATNKIVLWEN